MPADRTGTPRAARDRLLAWLRPHLPALAFACGLMLLQSAATLAQPWLGGAAADRLLSGGSAGRMLGLLLIAVVAQAALGYVVAIQLQKASGRIMADAGSALYAHLQALPLAWHQQRARGDVLALLTGDVYRLGSYVSATLVPLLPHLLTLVGALAVMYWLAPLVAAAMTVLMPLLYVLLKLAGRRLRPLGEAAMQAWGAQSGVAAQNLELLPLIKAYGADATEAGRYRAATDAVYEATLRQARWQAAIMPGVQVLGASLVLALLAFAGARVLAPGTGVGTLVTLFLYGMVLVAPIGQLANVYGATMTMRGAAQRLLDALSATVEVDAGTRQQFPAEASLSFENVGFAYPGRPALFDGLSITIGDGETVALTGPNGAGKSTLAHLLLRLVEPDGGHVRIGGIDVREFPLALLRDRVGLVAQQVMLMNASVAENILYGRGGASTDEVTAAARAARAHDFIMALPQGYATVIGDQGVRLSGGQRQRLALARALLKDPPILILDEATAMFDPAGEEEFIAQCHDVLRKRTVLLITHRPASLALADRVLRLDGGRLVEVGAAG